MRVCVRVCVCGTRAASCVEREKADSGGERQAGAWLVEREVLPAACWTWGQRASQRRAAAVVVVVVAKLPAATATTDPNNTVLTSHTRQVGPCD